MPKLFKGIRRSPVFQKLKNKTIYGIKALEYIFLNIGVKKEKRSIYIFNHIPKCGGTSLRIIMRNWFCIIDDYPPHDLKFSDKTQHELALQNFIENKPNYLNIKPWELISGHYHLPEFEISLRFPGVFENSQVRVITFVREPLDLMFSHFYYGKKKGHSYILWDTIEEYLLNAMPNQLAHAIGCTESNYIERLDSYFFIGVLENFEDSINTLARLLGKTLPINTPHSNSSNKELVSGQLEDSVLKKFKARNKLDYLVYEYVKTKINSF